jgi:hypothetical protein
LEGLVRNRFGGWAAPGQKKAQRGQDSSAREKSPDVIAFLLHVVGSEHTIDMISVAT